MSMFSKNIYQAIVSKDVLQTLSFGMSNMYFVVTLVGVTLGVIFTPRAFCHFCPQGTLQKGIINISHKKSEIKKVTISDKDSCVTCRLCNKKCLMEIEVIDEIENDSLQNMNCIKCSKCVEVCPKNLLSIK